MVFEVVVTRCLCPPPDPGPRHVCVHGGSNWLLGPDGWHRVGKSRFLAARWLDLCETWDDVLAVADEIRLEPVR